MIYLQLLKCMLNDPAEHINVNYKVNVKTVESQESNSTELLHFSKITWT